MYGAARNISQCLDQKLFSRGHKLHDECTSGLDNAVGYATMLGVEPLPERLKEDPVGCGIEALADGTCVDIVFLCYVILNATRSG